ncbi:MAG: nucleotide pyrophosphohydrolase [Clostridium sp.]
MRVFGTLKCNKDVSVKWQLTKMDEEYKELKIAVENGDVDNIAEETLDIMQVCINILGTLFDQEQITEEVIKHNAKLKGRGHELDKTILVVRGN